jgi:DNA-directed RNA polymerase subunit RPC12/RpoP
MTDHPEKRRIEGCATCGMADVGDEFHPHALCHHPVREAESQAQLKRQDRAIERIRKVARDHGYAVAIHGSRERDLDLIAVPWTEEASSAQKLLDALSERENCIYGPPNERPHGRVGYVLHGFGGCKYVDLSITPRKTFGSVEEIEQAERPSARVELSDPTKPPRSKPPLPSRFWRPHMSDQPTPEQTWTMCADCGWSIALELPTPAEQLSAGAECPKCGVPIVAVVFTSQLEAAEHPSSGEIRERVKHLLAYSVEPYSMDAVDAALAAAESGASDSDYLADKAAIEGQR